MDNLTNTLLDYLDLTPGEKDKIQRFIDGLIRFDKSKRLISYSTLDDLVKNHIEDSIKAYRLLSNNDSFIDMGSGNGLPGLIFSILSEGSDITLVDIDKKKCEFLKTMTYRLNIGAKVLHKSIFDVDTNKVPRGTVFLYRAFSPKDIATAFISKNKDLSHVYFASSQQKLEIVHKKELYYELSNGVSRKLLIF